VEWVLAGGIVVFSGTAVGLLALLARRARRRGTAGQALAAAMSGFDEGFHATAHDTFVEQRAQAERGAGPASAPGRR
jgi:hypothetical protein